MTEAGRKLIDSNFTTLGNVVMTVAFGDDGLQKEAR
jgi:hypothetical protein